MIECKKNEILRKSYTRKGNKRIPASCIKRTTTHKQSSANFRKMTKKRMSLRLRGKKQEVPQECKKGEILRKRYMRIISKTGKHVYTKEHCIPDRGAAGMLKGPGIGPLHKNELSDLGYKSIISLTEMERHTALAKAVKKFGSLATWRKVNAIYVYTKNTNKLLHSILDKDRNWIKKTYGLKAI